MIKISFFMLLSIFLLSCGENSNNGNIVINVSSRWATDVPDEVYYRKKVEEFNKLDNGITVVMDNIATESDYLDKLRVSFANNDAPNVFIEYGGLRTLDYIESDALLNIKPYYDEDSEWYNSFYPTMFKDLQYEGYDGIWGIPFKTYTILLYYNKDIFQKYCITPPETFDELLLICKKLKDVGVKPFQVGEKDVWRFGHFHNNVVIKSLGVNAAERLANGTLSYNSQSMIYTYRIISDMVKNGYFGDDILKDILKQLATACKNNDMKLGLYYSQAQDWYDPNGLSFGKDNSEKDYQYYLDNKVKPQLKEILTNYGDIALIWFDTPMESTKEQSQSLFDLVKSIQPNCIVSGRIGNKLGEYMTTSDNFIPRFPYDGDWEIPATLNDTWGFNKNDNNWKKHDDIIRILLKVISRGGNYLLNIGPDSLGNIPKGSIEVLDKVGKYVKENEDAIFGSKVLDIYPYELEWAQFTQKDYKLFVHLLSPKVYIELPNIKNRVKKSIYIKK